MRPRRGSIAGGGQQEKETDNSQLPTSNSQGELASSQRGVWKSRGGHPPIISTAQLLRIQQHADPMSLPRTRLMP